MQFLNSTADDLDAILALYDAAIALQKEKSHLHWLPFDVRVVQTEIAEGRQRKIVLDGRIACIFLTADSDPNIWGEADTEPSMYLHRIVTDPSFRGRNFVIEIVKWCSREGKTLGKQFIRLDTWSENPRLKELYLKCGFQFVRTVAPSNLGTLPAHYAGITLDLFEKRID
jgi:GNAT superfamily N-acetyltransferase